MGHVPSLTAEKDGPVFFVVTFGSGERALSAVCSLAAAVLKSVRTCVVSCTVIIIIVDYRRQLVKTSSGVK